MNQTHEFRQYSPADKLLSHIDKVLKTLSTTAAPEAPNNPAANTDDADLDKHERQVSAGLMRVNHTGEVCAQALYQGQAMTATLEHVKADMENAAQEEEQHLRWCTQRLDELDSHQSFLNPAWYAASFALGASAGLISDKVSLGFVAAVEDQVCKHLSEHLERLPEKDLKSRAIVEKMLEDEARHAKTAIDAGGIRFPAPVKSLMTLCSKAMTRTSYWI